MEHYYQYTLNLIYIFEMPWLMNAGFKVKIAKHMPDFELVFLLHSESKVVLGWVVHA